MKMNKDSENENDGVIYECNMIKANTASSQLLTVNAKIYDKFCLALLDPGSMVCTISKKLVDELCLKINESFDVLETAGENTSKVIGITDQIEIEVKNRKCSVKFYVLDNKYDVILGLNWFQAMSAGVFIDKNGRKVLKFSSREYDLDLEGFIENTDDDSNLEILNTELDDDEFLIDENWPSKGRADTMMEETEKKIEKVIFLNKNQKQQILKLILNYIDNFAVSYEDLGDCKVGFHIVETTCDKPINLPPYRVPERLRETLRAEIDRMLKAKIIRPSRSPWSFRVIIVIKKDKTIRLCVDFRPLNAITLQEVWPLPIIKEILEKLSKSKWFSKLDLKCGYWQIKMGEKSITKVAFSTSDGHYEFLRLPFGLKNAPAEFCRIMKMILGHLKFVEVYLDDIIIHSETFEQHLNHIKIVFEELEKANLKLNPEKCEWCLLELKIFGHVISHNKIGVDPEKIKVINDRLAPKNVKQVQSFIGMCNWYRRFILNFSFIAAPLFDLLAKDEPFVWSNKCEIAFQELKKILTSFPILRPPDFSREFILYADACAYAIGFILSQIDKFNREYNVEYGSRLLKGSELNYGITEKECLAVVYAIKSCHIYLFGAKFKVVTDHSALKWLLTMSDPVGRIARWSYYLEQYNFVVEHRAGKNHANADYMSRPVLAIENVECQHNNLACMSVQRHENDDESAKNLDVTEDSLLLYYLKFGHHVRGISKCQTKRVEGLSKKYKLVDDKLFIIRKADAKLLQVPNLNERTVIIEKAHKLGHYRALSTYERLKDTFFWKNMFNDIKNYISKCTTCNRHHKEPAVNHPAVALKVDGVNDRISIDLILGLKTTQNGHNGILVITEYLTKFPYIVPIKSKEASEIAFHLLMYISIFGPPKVILSDQGTEFCNKIVDTMLSSIGIEHSVTSGYNPRTNGMVERFNQTLIESLRKHAEMDVENWDKWIPYVGLSYRTRVHSTTEKSPYELLFGFKMLFFGDWKHEKTDSEVAMLTQRSIQIQELIEKREKALAIIADKQVAQKAIQDKQNKIRFEQLEPGTTVYVKREGMLGKLEPRYEGPYKIVRKTSMGNYEIVDPTNAAAKKTYPLHKLKVVEDDDTLPEFSVEVRRILDHRKAKKGFDYLVEWADGSENSWVHESNFNTVEIINEYKKMLREKNARTDATGPEVIQSKKRKRGRPSKKYNCITVNPWMSLIGIVFFLLVGFVSGAEIKSNFKFCDVDSGYKVLDVESLCEHKTENLIENVEIYNYANSILVKNNEGSVERLKWFVYNKLHEIVSGEGFQCKKIKLTRIYNKGFFGEEHSDSYEDNLPLSAADCWEMVRTRKCNGSPMLCNGKSCFFKDKSEPKYSWWSKVIKEEFQCEFVPRVVQAKEDKSSIFTENCKVSDLFCLLGDSTIVWDRSVIHDCPFNQIYSSFFFRDSDDTSLYFDTEKHIAVKLIKLEKYCNKTVIKTAEGLYLSSEILPGTELNLLDSKGLQDLMLSDFDYSTRGLFKIAEKIDYGTCKAIQISLSMFRSLNDKFMLLNDFNKNDVILYTNNGLILLPTCVNIHAINIMSETKQCYADIPITFTLKNKIVNGFLSEHKILKRTSKNIPCKNSIKYVQVDDFLIVNKENISSNKKLNDVFESYKLNLINDDLSHYNYEHSHEVVEGLDFIEEIKKYTEVTEINGDFLVVPSEKIEIMNEAKTVVDKVGMWFESIWNKFVIVLYFIGFLIVVFFCIGLSVKFGLFDKKRDDSFDKVEYSKDKDYDKIDFVRVEDVIRDKVKFDVSKGTLEWPDQKQSVNEGCSRIVLYKGEDESGNGIYYMKKPKG